MDTPAGFPRTDRGGRCVVLGTPNKPLELHELRVPAPGPGGVVARVSFGGVCGTDVHLWHGEYPLPYPIVLGHEGIGVLEDLGAGVTHDHAGASVKKGDAIYWCPIAACHRCYYCTVVKDFTACENASWFGPISKPTWGSYADYVSLPAGMAFYRVPDDTPAEAVIALGCALPTILLGLERLGGIAPGDKVVVQGCGPVGLAAVLMAKLSGASTIIAVDSSELRMRTAQRFGATHLVSLKSEASEDARRKRIREICDGRGPDVAIEGAGKKDAFLEGLNLLGRNGRYLLVGLWASQGGVQMDPSYIVRNSLKVIGTQYASPEHYYKAMMIAARYHREFPLVEAITHRCGLPNADRALHLVESGQAVKVVMEPGKARD